MSYHWLGRETRQTPLSSVSRYYPMSARKQVRIQVHLRTFVVRNMNRRRDIVLTVILTLTGLSSGLRSMEDLEEDVEVNVPVELEEGLVVTVLKRPAKCLREAAVGDHLTVHYTGRLGDGEGSVFDTSLKTGWPPYKFQLGSGRVIEGYERGTPGMCQGEKRTLLVPPSLAYGERGVPGTIPANATLHFTVECLEIMDGVLPTAPPPPREKVSQS